MSLPLPPPPYKAAMQDKNGLLTNSWLKWFQTAFVRMGGSVALSNTELAGAATGSVTQLQASIAALQAKIDQVGSQVLTATSTPKVANGSGNYQLLAGNSIVLTSGRWLLTGMVQFDQDGTPPNWTKIASMWAAINGDDTPTEPTPLSTVPNLTVLSALKTTGPQTGFEPGSTFGLAALLPAETVVVSVATGSTARVFLDSGCLFSGLASDTLITAFLTATLLRTTP